MAAVDTSFTVVANETATEYVGGTKTQQVVVVSITTNAHGAYAEARVPKNIWTAQLGRAAAIAPATIIETLYSLPGVVGVQWGQETNASGLLIDTVLITVQSDSGNSTGQLGPLVMSQLGPDLHGPQIAALVAQLNDAEGPSS